MNENFNEWMENLDDSVYAFFSESLSDFEGRFGLDLEGFFESGVEPDDIVYEIQKLIEEEEYQGEDE